VEGSGSGHGGGGGGGGWVPGRPAIAGFSSVEVLFGRKGKAEVGATRQCRARR